MPQMIFVFVLFPFSDEGDLLTDNLLLYGSSARGGHFERPYRHPQQLWVKIPHSVKNKRHCDGIWQCCLLWLKFLLGGVSVSLCHSICLELESVAVKQPHPFAILQLQTTSTIFFSLGLMHIIFAHYFYHNAGCSFALFQKQNKNYTEQKYKRNM
jgi:hypothetical protein